MNDEPPPGLDDLPRELAPARDLWPGIRTRLEAEVAPPVRRFPWRRALALAAALLLLGVVWAGWRVSQYTWRVGAQPFDAGATLATGVGEEARILLPGLGHIDLEANTSLVLEHLGLREQRARVDAGALSVVVSAPPRLLVLDTPHARVVDLGCAYTLRVDGAGTRVAVTSGAVLVLAEGAACVVPAGQDVQVDAAGEIGDLGSLESIAGAHQGTPSWRRLWRWAWSFVLGGGR